MEAIYQLVVSVEAGRDTRRLERMVNLFLDTPGIELNARCIENKFHGRKSVLGFTLGHFLGMSSVGMSWFSSVQNRYGHKPLHGLVNNGGSFIPEFEIPNEQCYQFLLEKGGVELCKIKNEIGFTPLFTAANRGKDDKVRHMLEMGADHSLVPDSDRYRNFYAINVEEVRAEISTEANLKILRESQPS